MVGGRSRQPKNQMWSDVAIFKFVNTLGYIHIESFQVLISNMR